MKNQQTFLCGLLAVFSVVSTAVASPKRREFKGTIVAYDPSYHSLKQASFVKNLEVTIADVGAKPSDRTFVKLIFEGFGTQQVADDVLKGRTPFNVQAIRNTSCDEGHPHVLTDVNSFQGSGTFLLNETYQAKTIEGISSLECYRVSVGK